MIDDGLGLDYEQFHDHDLECFTEEYISELEFLSYDKHNFRIIKVQGKMTAMLYMEIRGDSLHISRLGVKKAYRRRGFAKALMDGAKDFAKIQGIKRLTLSVVSLNDPAVSLFESMGFVAYRRQYRFFVPMYNISDSPKCDVKIEQKINGYVFKVLFYKRGVQVGQGVLNTEMGGCKNLILDSPKDVICEVLSGIKSYLKPGAGGLYLMTHDWMVVNECLNQGFDADNVIIHMELNLS